MNTASFTAFTEPDAITIARGFTGFVSSFLLSYGVTSITLALLTTFLWWWLAALLAVIAGVGAGVIGGSYLCTKGVDHAVEALGWLKARFA